MEGRIRSKLTQTLAAFVMIAVAIVVPLSSNSIHSHAASASSQASWNIVPSPSPSTIADNKLQAVSSFYANHAWAVGSYQNTDGSYHDLIEYWNGSSWTEQTGANPGGASNILYGVKALSATNIWAVGSYYSNDGTGAHALIEHSK